MANDDNYYEDKKSFRGDINKVLLRGNATADADYKRLPPGVEVATFALATHFGNRDRGTNGTEFHRVVAWGDIAQTALRQVVKGSRVLVKGRLQTRKYEDAEGHTRYQTEVVAYEITTVTRKAEANDPRSEEAPEPVHKEDPPQSS